MGSAGDRGASAIQRHVSPAVFAVATLVAAAILLTIVVVPQLLAHHRRWEMLRARVAEIGQLASSVVDGDLQRQLSDPKNYSQALYDRALGPLLRFHAAEPDIFYLYTMVEKEGVPYFVLDTASSPEFRTPRRQASRYMQRFDIRPQYDDGWLTDLASGKTYVTPNFERDDYGDFLSAHAPIYDSQHRYVGFIGVDFDLAYYIGEEHTFTLILIGSVAVALALSLAIGTLVALYDATMRRRMQELYENSIHDGLTGLLNRRGALDLINPLASPKQQNAMLVIDIDNLKMVNDLKGHVTGDAVIARTADAIRQSVRRSDQCARLGGDEFMVFAPGCDLDDAQEIATRIVAKLAKPDMPLAGVKFGASIGIAVHRRGAADFAQMYHDADAALYQAREDGGRIGVFEPSRKTAPAA